MSTSGSTTTANRIRVSSAPKAASSALRGWPSYCFSIWITQNWIMGQHATLMTDGTHFFTAW